ncbi:MAG: serine dehydratase, partial [Pseudoflavonifractor sp.]
MDLRDAIAAGQPLTMGETIALAKEYNARVVDVVLIETELRTGLSREAILTGIMDEYAHNLKAVEIGVK